MVAFGALQGQVPQAPAISRAPWTRLDELVPQDPTDEPASVLLERIRAARETTAEPKRPGKRPRKPKAAQ